MYNDNKLPYPKQILFFHVNNVLERFANYGVIALLSTFLSQYLGQSDKLTKIIFHFFLALSAFMPLYGAMLSDFSIGKFRTTVINSVIYNAGLTLLMVSALPGLLNVALPIALIALILIATGKGGMKVPSLTLAGDQYSQPEQRHHLLRFYSWLYFATHTTMIVAIAVLPYIRSKPCFGYTSCYFLAFTLTLVFNMLALGIFVAGRTKYILMPPKGNLLIDILKCVTHALKQKRVATEWKDHWLDHASDKFDEQFIYDLKTVLRVIIVFIPVPLYWAVYDQQGSAWIFMARNMNGDIGFYTILPEHAMLITSLLILIAIPLFDYFIYPIFERMRLFHRHLQRIVMGAVLTAVTTLIAAVICFKIEENLPRLADLSHAHLFYYNNNPCDVTVEMRDASTNDTTEIVIGRMAVDLYRYDIVNATGGAVTLELNATGSCLSEAMVHRMKVDRQTNYGVHISDRRMDSFVEHNERHRTNSPKIRFLYSGEHAAHMRCSLIIDNVEIVASKPGEDKMYELERADKYLLDCASELIVEKLEINMGGVYVMLINAKSPNNADYELVAVTKAHNVHLWWMLPQSITLACAETMLSITGMQFSYSEAPKSMNTLVMATWTLTTSVGNLLVMVIEAVTFFHKLSHNFLMYTLLMLLDVAVLAYLASKYVYYTGSRSHHDRE